MPHYPNAAAAVPHYLNMAVPCYLKVAAAVLRYLDAAVTVPHYLNPLSRLSGCRRHIIATQRPLPLHYHDLVAAAAAALSRLVGRCHQNIGTWCPPRHHDSGATVAKVLQLSGCAMLSQLSGRTMLSQLSSRATLSRLSSHAMLLRLSGRATLSRLSSRTVLS